MSEPQAGGRLQELSRLASGLCQDARVQLELGDRWAWSPSTRRMLVNHEDLLVQSVETCAGIVAHEAGHHLISRYHEFLPVLRGTSLLGLALNAIEDARVEAYLPLRYPGVAPWLRQARGTMEFGNEPSLLVQFLLAIAASSTLDLGALPLAPRVREALEATAAAREQAVRGFLPGPWPEGPPGFIPDAQLDQRLAPRYRGPRGPRERYLLHLALGALEASLPILEVARQLDALDRAAGREASRTLLHERLERVALGEAVGAGHPDDPGPPPAPPEDRERLVYERALLEVRPQLEGLRASLERSLPARRSLAWRPGFTSGQRVDLRRAMQAEADPQQGLRVWSRKNIPTRRRAAFGLLVDLSGSMRREGRIEGAMAAVALFAEALTSLAIPFRIDGFQDELIPLIDFGQPLDRAARGRLGAMALEVRGMRPGGRNQPGYNDDGPCLLEAAGHLLARPEDDRILVVLCDGYPEGRRSNTGDLRAAIRQLSPRLTLIGLGLGPSTAHVARLYPIARARLAVPELARELGALLQQQLEGAAPVLARSR